MGLHRREATDESSLLEVDGLANFAGERLRLSEPAVYRPRLQAIHSTVSESTIPGSGPSLAQLPYEPAAAAPFYATSSRIRAPDDDHRGFPAPVERNQVGDLGLHGYRRPPMREYDLNYTGHRRLGEMNPFFRGDAEPQGNYFREGFHISETLNDATHSRNHPADIETARPYLGQSSRADANLEAEPPLPSRYTGTPPNLQQGKLNQDRTSLRLVGRRRRVLARWLQAIGAVVVAGGALGGTFYADPPQTPPPAGSTALIALCILPFLSLCCSLYFFYLRHRRSRKKQLLKMRMENQELRSGGYAYPTVNFIVDPGYFARMAES
ncbi:hypothetical protein B0A53_04750 [Rhodotorula sp. CCFEE 5036]|nr:hypothetical protein B0A53_04750 [Rhodotorula sp. CCFEE 5036]